MPYFSKENQSSPGLSSGFYFLPEIAEKRLSNIVRKKY